MFDFTSADWLLLEGNTPLVPNRSVGWQKANTHMQFLSTDSDKPEHSTNPNQSITWKHSLHPLYYTQKVLYDAIKNISLLRAVYLTSRAQVFSKLQVYMSSHNRTRPFNTLPLSWLETLLDLLRCTLFICKMQTSTQHVFAPA